MEISGNYSQILKSYQKELGEYQTLREINKPEVESKDEQKFGETFSNALNKLDQSVEKTSQNTTDLITGELDNVHSLMIDMSQAQLTLQTAVQVRNKCVDAYNEVKNMQF